MNLGRIRACGVQFRHLSSAVCALVWCTEARARSGNTCAGRWYSRPTGAMPRIWPKRLPGPRPEPASEFLPEATGPIRQ